MKTLILNIKQLVQTELSPRKWVAGNDMARLGILENAYLLVEVDKIAVFGKMEDLNREAVYAGGDIVKEIDATGRLVMPSYCDLILIWFMPEAVKSSISIKSVVFLTKK